MKILFCSDALTIDGVTSYILNVGAALRRAGHDIAVLGRWAGKGFQARYRHEGMKVISCPSAGVGNFWFDMQAKKFAPDVIMTDPRRSFPLATRIKKITHSPVITYFLDPVEKTDRPGRDIDSLIKYSDAWTAFEPDILARLHEINPPLPVVKMTRPLDVFFTPCDLHARDPFNILCFGRLSRYKTPGIFYLLDNIARIQEHIPDFMINILGGGGWRLYKIKYLAHKINSSIGRRCVNIIGTQDNPRNFIEKANVILGGATSAMEAAYSLRPVIGMSGRYFGRVTSANLTEGIKSYFAERYGTDDFSPVLDDVLSVYDSYHDKSFIDDLHEISRRLGQEFSQAGTLDGFEEILSKMSGIQWHPKNSA